jgi:ParB/RepB/Spo0J family partition protein
MKKRGQQVPVIGFLEEHKFLLLDGERRLRAALIAGLAEMSAMMLTERPSRAELRMLQHSLDAQRVNLNLMERSDLVAEIQNETGWGVSELAAQLSISQPECTKLISCQRLPKPIQEMVRRDALGIDKAYLLSQEPDSDKQLALAQAAATLSRDQFSGKVKSKGEGARAKRAAFRLSSGMTVVISGGEMTLEHLLDGLASLVKELRRGLAQGLDIVGVQCASKKKAKVKS